MLLDLRSNLGKRRLRHVAFAWRLGRGADDPDDLLWLFRNLLAGEIEQIPTGRSGIFAPEIGVAVDMVANGAIEKMKQETAELMVTPGASPTAASL